MPELQCLHGGSPARQCFRQAGVVAPLYQKNQPGSGEYAVGPGRVREPSTERIDKIVHRGWTERGAHSGHFALHDSLDDTVQQRRARTEVVGRRPPWEACALVDPDMCERPQALGSQQVDRGVDGRAFPPFIKFSRHLLPAMKHLWFQQALAIPVSVHDW